MRYALTVLAVLMTVCVLSAAEPTKFYLVNGELQSSKNDAVLVASVAPAGYTTVCNNGTCYYVPVTTSTWGPVNAAPSTWGPAVASAPACPCVTANGSCPCAGTNLPMPMAGPGWSYSLATRTFTPLRDVVDAQPVRSMFRSFFNAVQNRPRLTFVR